MVSEITNGIRVSVQTEYQAYHSNPLKQHYVFAYRIRIENHSSKTVRLLRRFWEISDLNGNNYTVEGEGVVGLQPIIEPNESHEYVSGCNFETPLGKMSGFYTMEKLQNGQNFDVTIPEFVMVVPYLLN
jgi:ApaG protein